MRPLAGQLRPRQAAPDATEALLGPSHPLARALDDSRRVRRQLAAVAAVMLGAGAAAAVEGTGEPSLFIAGAITLIAWCCRLALLGERTRREARRAVIDGRECVPLACIRAECRRLADPWLHQHLARWAEELAQGATAWPAPSLWSAAAVRACAPQLREVARLIRAGQTGVRGMAMLERLLTSGVMPAHGDDARALTEELGRIRYHLCSQR
jgi:hypothetical protein